MKNFIRAFFAALLLSAAPLSAGAFNYKVTGNIKGLPDGATVELLPLSHMDVKPIAGATVNNGTFVLSGDFAEPTVMLIMVKNAYGSTRFILEEGETSITGNASAENRDDGKVTYSFNGVVVSGSPLTDAYRKMMQPRLELDARFIANQQKGMPLIRKYMQARSEGNQSLMDSIESTPEYKEYMAVEKECFANFDKVLDDAVTANKDSFLAPVAMLSQLSYISAEMKKYYDMFSEDAKNTYAGKQVAAELFPVGQLGDKTPAFNVVDINGNNLSIEEVCKKNKYVLLDFWASWCRPCRKEIPNIKAIYDKHHAAGFEVVSVSIDTDANAWRKAVAKEALPWENVMDTDKGISNLYHVSAVPTMYLLDSEGRLVADRLRGEDLSAKIDELLAE
ncbi:MAG: AhpC/TSA family protein [Muribaculaceae bacterium]|nr:AhpC/TSA family protein [Muribaculaceae bacterium]